MLVKDLKELLNDVDDNLQVRLCADHGQALMKLSGYGEAYIDEDVWYPEEVNEVDEDSIKVFVLEAM